MFSSEWVSQPAVLSCGSSGDSLENVKCNIPSLKATEVTVSVYDGENTLYSAGLDAKVVVTLWSCMI